ncbi:MAG: helix-turn-helix domain-containing protein, partial [Gammaproteobacteria bacterium]
CESTPVMSTGYRTLDLNEASEFLRMSPAVLRQKARSGIIKGAKPGKRWVFLECDQSDYEMVRRYAHLSAEHLAHYAHNLSPEP